MNAFESGQLVEARGMAVLEPFLREKSDGRFVILQHGPLARALQETRGDVIFTGPTGQAWSAEIKIEEAFTGNFFFETWSNLNLEDRDSYMKRGNNPGWMIKTMADVLLYYFLKNDDLYAMDLFRLKKWLFTPELGRNIDKFPEVPQRKRCQRNDTWGRLVEIDKVAHQVGLRQLKVKQLTFLPEPSLVDW